MGAVTVSGPTAIWSTNETLCIGCMGNGMLEIFNGAFVINRDAIVGEEPGSLGDVLVAGPGSTWSLPFFLTIDNGVVTVTDSGTLNVGNVAFGGITIFNDGVLQGDGFINGNVANFGEMNPGLSPGILTINGDYKQVGPIAGFGDASGSLLIDVAGPTPGLEHDVLDVTGTVTLGGGLFVNLIAPFDPAQGQTFSILSTPTPVIGAFDVAFMPALPGGRFMRVAFSAGAAPGPAGATIIVDDLASFFGFGLPIEELVNGLPTDVVVADLDADGDNDLAITIPSDVGAGSVLVLPNAGTDANGQWLGFEAPTQIFVGTFPTAITSGLFNQDNLVDLAVANGGDNDVSVLLNTSSGGLISFSRTDYPAGGTAPSSLGAAQLDGDLGNSIDLVVANKNSDNLTILANDGNGIFNQIGTVALPPGALAAQVDPADIDNDKRGDLIVAMSGLNQIALFKGNGDGTFGGMVAFDVGVQPTDLVVGLLDGDTFPDIVSANLGDGTPGSGTVSVLRNDGAGSLLPAVNLTVGDSSRSITAFDAELDGELDLAVVVDDPGLGRLVRVLRNDLSNGQLAFALDDNQAVGENPVLVTSGKMDSDALDDLITISAIAAGAAAVAGPQQNLLSVRLNFETCPSDCQEFPSGAVDVPDLLALLGAWGGPQTPGTTCDFDGNGAIEVPDLLQLLASWGPCP